MKTKKQPKMNYSTQKMFEIYCNVAENLWRAPGYLLEKVNSLEKEDVNFNSTEVDWGRASTAHQLEKERVARTGLKLIARAEKLQKEANEWMDITTPVQRNRKVKTVDMTARLIAMAKRSRSSKP